MGGGFSTVGEAFVAPSGAFVANGGLGLNGRDFISGSLIPVPPANIDLNFETGQYIGVVGLPTAFLTTVRAAPAAYAVDNSGNWTSFAANLPRITNLGLTIEESRANRIRNNSMVGAVVGTPGTLPTNWSEFLGTGTRSVVAVGTENGINYVDIRLNGSASGQYALYFDTNIGVPVANGQTFTLSAFVKIAAGSTTNITSFFSAADQYSSVPAFLSTIGNQSFIPPATANPLGQSRGQSTFATNNAAVASVQPYISLIMAAGAFDITLRVGWPQFELGGAVSTPIPTASGSVTRAADVISLTNTPVFGNGYSSFVQSAPRAAIGTGIADQYFLVLDDGTINNYSRLFRSGLNGDASMTIVSGGGVGATGVGAVWNSNIYGKIAGSVNTVVNGNMAFNGVSVGVPQVGPAGSLLSAVNIGSFGGANFLNGDITHLSIWTNTVLNTGQLAVLTT